MSRITEQRTAELMNQSAHARARVEADVERLSQALTPARLQARALDVAERSVENLAIRALQRVTRAPQWVSRWASERPLVAAAVAAGLATLLGWRVARRRRG